MPVEPAVEVISRNNNVGLLRLLLAILVIFGHSPEIIDGDRHREPLTLIFHSISLGTIAVDYFFILSGFLITKSAFDCNSIALFFERRIFRIYPAFIFAYMICVFMISPIDGAHISQPFRTIYRMCFLASPPVYDGLLSGLRINAINGSMWTLAYEFRFYILIGLLWKMRVFTVRPIIMAAAVCFALLSLSENFAACHAFWQAIDRSSPSQLLFGLPSINTRLLNAFLVGCCVYLYRVEVWRWLNFPTATACMIMVALALSLKMDPEWVLINLGAFALFYLGFKANIGPMQRINANWDISYGVYLYGWPVAATLLWFNRGLAPLTLSVLTTLVAVAAGLVSWYALERWFRDLGHLMKVTGFRSSRESAAP